MSGGAWHSTPGAMESLVTKPLMNTAPWNRQHVPSKGLRKQIWLFPYTQHQIYGVLHEELSEQRVDPKGKLMQKLVV